MTPEEEFCSSIVAGDLEAIDNSYFSGSLNPDWRYPKYHHGTALHVACHEPGSFVAFDYIFHLQKNEVNVRDDLGQTAFMVLCRNLSYNEDLVLAQIFLCYASVDLNLPDLANIRPMEALARLEKLEIMRWIIASGRDLDLDFGSHLPDNPAVQLLRQFSQHPEATRRQVRADLKIETTGWDLMWATFWMDVEKVKLLLQNPDTQVNWIDPIFKVTPFYSACAQGCAEIIELYLQHSGILTDRQGKSGCTPLDRACIHGWADCVSILLGDPRVVANVSANGTMRPLNFAIHARREKTVRVLLAHPAIDPNSIMSPSGDRPLHWACRFNYPRIVQLLLESPRVDARLLNSSREGPLHCAAKFNQVANIQLLMADRRFEVNDVNACSETPLAIACEHGNYEAVKCLLAYKRTDPNVRGRALANTLHTSKNKHPILQCMVEDWRLEPNTKTNSGTTALYTATYQNDLQAVRILLSSCRKLQLPYLAPGIVVHPHIAVLLEAYRADVNQVRCQLRLELGLVAADVFAHVVFLSDDFLVLAPELPASPPARRFFAIAQQLPQELQMVLCNRLQNTASNLIPLERRIQAFRYLAFTWPSTKKSKGKGRK